MQVNQTAELLQLDSKNLQDMAKAMGKLMIVSLVWSSTDLLDKNVPTAVRPEAEAAQ
ncbi:MAG: hypothetical protein AB4352_14005 [Hormoscilla sp.]